MQNINAIGIKIQNTVAVDCFYDETKIYKLWLTKNWTDFNL